MKVEIQKAERKGMKNVYATVEMKYGFPDVDFGGQRAVDVYRRKYVEIDLEVIECEKLVCTAYLQI